MRMRQNLTTKHSYSMKPITDLTLTDALSAARQTGLSFEGSTRTDWGILVRGVAHPQRVRWDFAFEFRRDKWGCGLVGLITPNIHLVTDWLRENGYDLGK